MMASSKTRLPKDESLPDKDFEGVISEGEETECADKIWEYYERRMDELEDLDEYAKKRGLVKLGDLACRDNVRTFFWGAASRPTGLPRYDWGRRSRPRPAERRRSSCRLIESPNFGPFIFACRSSS